MADVSIRLPVVGDAEALAARMREQDVEEVRAAGETDLVAVVRDGIACSTLCWTAIVDDQVAAVFGVTPLEGLLGDVGVPWLLGTDQIAEQRRALVRLAPTYIARMLRVYPHLLNFVHARNSVAIRWLRRSGFVLQEAVPYGPLGTPFHRFDLEAL